MIVERLLFLADLTAQIPEKRFDMAEYQCGSVTCALGAAARTKTWKQWVCEYGGEGRLYRETSTFGARELLKISGREHTWLFGVAGYPEFGGNPPPWYVAARLRDFAKGVVGVPEAFYPKGTAAGL